MAWVKIENNIVIQKQPYQENGFVEVADSVVCGMIQQGDSFVVPTETFEEAIAKLRRKRNLLLLETDWTANSDVTMSEAMTTDRQSLRDITNGLTTVEQVNAVVFPEKPTE